MHIRKVYATREAPGLEFSDELSVCISGASCRNNSILKTTFYDCALGTLLTDDFSQA